MDRTPEFVEKMHFTDKGTVWSGKAADAGDIIRHLPDGYTVVSDNKEGDTRTIVLREMDKTPRMKKTKELVDAIASALKESRSKTFKRLLTDVLEDCFDEELDELYHKVVEKKEPVMVEEGCFKIVCGIGSKQKEIMLRE